MFRIGNQEWANRIFLYLSKNRLLIVLSFSLLMGILFGGILIRSPNTYLNMDISYFFDHYISARSNRGILPIFLYSVSSSFFHLLVAYCLGLFVFGTVPSLLLPGFNGLGIGVVCGHLYSTYGLKGAAFSLLIVIPIAYLKGLILLVACKEGVLFSIDLLGLYTKAQHHSETVNSFKKYSLRFLFLMIFSVVISLLDGILSGVFLAAFDF